MPNHRRDPSANSLAHGAVKTADIEEVRRAIERAERQAVNELRAAVVRSRRDSARRERLISRLIGMA